MRHQLELIEPTGWKLDDRTKKIGREGIRNAREALRAARPGTDDATDDDIIETKAA